MNQAKIGRYSVKYFDREEFTGLKKEIFDEEIYSVDLKVSKPVILDIGAYIGLSVFYFKSRFPLSTVIAVEPNPTAFDILRENIEINNLADVILINKAVWKTTGKKGFFIDGTERGWNSTAGFYNGMWTGRQKTREIAVDTVTLNDLVGDRGIDLMKVDIEGAETAVLTSSEKALKQVQNIIVEFHSLNKRQSHRLLKFLQELYKEVAVTQVDQGLSVLMAEKLKK